VEVEEHMPIQYARAHKKRIVALLGSEAEESIKRQLRAVLFAIENKNGPATCTGLDKLCYCLDEWERRYSVAGMIGN